MIKPFLRIILLICLINPSAYSQNTITIPSGLFQVDHTKKVLLSNVDISILNSEWIDENTTSLHFDEVYTLLQNVANFNYGSKFTVKNPNGTEYKLYFTKLPIIHITTPHTIVDEPRLFANFHLSENNGTIMTSNIGIEYRGGFSQSYPKKSLRLEFWEDSIGNETKDVQFLNMRSDDDWNLQAMYNEPLRFNNKTSFKIWDLIDTLHFLNDEPEAINGVNMEYSELFINNEYRGVYCMSERIDRKQVKLKKHNGSIRGELYKGISWGASTFSQISPYNNDSLIWSGFEYEHPEEEVNWANIYDFVSFVINSSDTDFEANYQSYFSQENAINYFIFLNLARLTDNTGKNVYIGKYKQNEPYFFIPWDLDGSFGVIWDGSNENITDDLLTNRFFTRLLQDCNSNGFYTKLQNRWNELRQDRLTHQNIMSLFMSNYNYLEENGVYEREEIAWEDYSFPTNQLSYMNEWLTNRLDYLDNLFTQPCGSLSLIKNEKNDLIIYPNPTSSTIHLHSNSNQSYRIKNAIGQIVLEGDLFAGENSIDIEYFEAGLYIMEANSGLIQKIVKK